MNRIIAIIILVSLFLIGFIKLYFNLSNIEKKNNKVVCFKTKLADFEEELKSKGFNNEIYEYLVLKSAVVQNTIGAFGVGDMKQPYSNEVIRDYHIIVNEVNNFYIYYDRGLDHQLGDSIMYVKLSITKYIGYIDNRMLDLKTELKNPLIWLREGIRAVVLFPIDFLYWTEIIQYSNYTIIKNNIVVKILSVLIGTIGFISAIVTIVTGYQPLIEIIDSMVK